MQNFSLRLLVVIERLERMIKKIASRKYGLAGIFICLIVVGFFSTVPMPVHADAVSVAACKNDCFQSGKNDPNFAVNVCQTSCDTDKGAAEKAKAAADAQAATDAKVEGTPAEKAAVDKKAADDAAVAAKTGSQNGFDKFILILANVALTVAVVISKLIVAIIDILMPIMLYNQFSTSPVVTNGWAIVRDTVNMFFVIVLIAIAFGTIFGVEKFKWQSQIVRLMIFAVVINFSKTLCGLMIDLGQVVMLTFANAIREIAAGNFIQMFGLSNIYSLSPQSDIITSAATDSKASGLQAFDFFAAALASVFMAVMVFGTMCMLLTILVYRIVMLWVLIVISPLAWFVGGAKGIISSGAYGEWWKEFVGLIAIGPVLTFFLWLTLVVAGAGNISDSAHITSGDTTATLASAGGTAGGLITKAFEMNRLISFVIAIAMLYAGFKAAKSVGGGGFVGKAIAGGAFNNQGINAVKGTAALGAKLGAGGLRLGGRAATGTVSGIASATGATDAISRGKERMLRGVAAGAGSGLIGRQISRAASSSADKEAAGRAAKVAEVGAKFKGDSRETKMDQLNRFADSPAGTPTGKKEAQALLMDAMGDEKSMKELRASGNLEKLWAEHGAAIQSNAKGNEGMLAKIGAFKKQNADITGSANQLKTVADVAGLSSFALADDESGTLKAQMEKIQTTIRTADGKGYYNALEAMKAGKIGNIEQQDAMTKGRSAIYEGMSAQELSRVPMKSLASNASDKLLASHPELAQKIANAATSAIKSDPNSDASKKLRSRMEALLGDANASDEVKAANKAFMAHMVALDARVKPTRPASTKTLEEDFAKKVTPGSSGNASVPFPEADIDIIREKQANINALTAKADIEYAKMQAAAIKEIDDVAAALNATDVTQAQASTSLPSAIVKARADEDARIQAISAPTPEPISAPLIRNAESINAEIDALNLELMSGSDQRVFDRSTTASDKVIDDLRARQKGASVEDEFSLGDEINKIVKDRQTAQTELNQLIREKQEKLERLKSELSSLA